MNRRSVKLLLPIAGVLALSWSFWASGGWLELCAGLALFLFGMQCLEEGLRELAGSKLEQLLARSTATPFKGLLFGVGGTMLLQSSTLVSLLTIASSVPA
ncbi:Na+/phosphate symporter [Pseudomonas sp. BAY1663]|nr:Na+/phosphate symporter [Pseudomonas sp. BAY1663]